MAIFVKYDVWPGYLNELIDRKIPTFLISATFRKDQFYFRWYGKFVTKRLKQMNRIFVQDKNSLEILMQNGFNNAMQCGDLRVDRVIRIRSSDENIAELERFVQGKTGWVFGSVYPSEIDLIKQIAENDQDKIIVAPHNIEKTNIDLFRSHFPDCILWTDFSNYVDQRFLIMNNVGMLNKIYKYGKAAYVGGGWGKGIHNILEPAVWGIPVFIGPEYQKFPEAESLIRANLIFTEKSIAGLAKIMSTNAKEFDPTQFGDLSKKWFNSHSGATDLIYSILHNQV